MSDTWKFFNLETVKRAAVRLATDENGWWIFGDNQGQDVGEADDSAAKDLAAHFRDADWCDPSTHGSYTPPAPWAR